MQSTPPTASSPLQRKMCPGCFSAPMFTCPPALLAPNDTCFWWLWLLVALAGVSVVVTLTCPPCRPPRACPPGSAFPLPQQWARGFGECHLQKMGVRHLHAVTLVLCASLHDWTLQYLQLLRLIETVCSPPHIPKFSSLLCIGYHKSPLASSIQVF